MGQVRDGQFERVLHQARSAAYTRARPLPDRAGSSSPGLHEKGPGSRNLSGDPPDLILCLELDFCAQPARQDWTTGNYLVARHRRTVLFGLAAATDYCLEIQDVSA